MAISDLLRRVGLRLSLIILLLLTTIGLQPGTARAAGVTISVLYPATKAAYDAWNATTSTARPPKTTSFPSGTTTVTFYFEYQGATPNKTTYTLLIHEPGGATVTHGPYVFQHDAGLHMSPVQAPAGKAYPDGAYSVDLQVDGQVVSTTTFTVGATSPVTIVTYYTATKQAFDAWNATSSTADPPKTTTFPSGTTDVAFYFHYRGATAKVTQFKLVVHRAGAVYLTDGPYTLTYVNGYYMDAVTAPKHAAYPAGTYSTDLVIGGVTVATTSFTVNEPTGASITILYPTTKTTYDAWNATTSTARPLKTVTFNRGTTIVAFYFEYKDAVAKSTQYQFVIHDASGKVFATYGPYTTLYKAALAMRYATAPHNGAFPDGRYHVDMLVDGRIRASTDFTVGSQGVTITAYYPATKKAFDAWSASTSTTPPPQTTTFGAGTTIVTFYFAYKGATPKTTQYKYIIYDHSGAVYVTHGPYVVSYTDGYQMSPVAAPHGAYASGAYRADLLIDGRVVQSSFFTVGAPQAPAACTANDYIATCIEPSILRLHIGGLPNNMVAEGTGFVVQSDAGGTYLLTNKHVVEGATAANMTAISPDGHTQYRVLAVVSNNAEAGTAGDLAVVKLPPTSLRPLNWGDSDHLKLLQPVISIGYGDAFDLPGPPTVTQGVISALHRDLGDGYGPAWIQHQSFINHGNSGGPLMDMSFNVIGVNTLSQKQTQGIFFAIPASLAQKVAQKLIAQLQGS